MKWKIIDEGRANQMKLSLIEAGDELYLKIDVKDIPQGMTPEQFIQFVKDEGVALVDE